MGVRPAVDSLIENPAFDPRTQERPSTRVGDVRSSFEPSDTFVKSLPATDLVDRVLASASLRQNKEVAGEQHGKERGRHPAETYIQYSPRRRRFCREGPTVRMLRGETSSAPPSWRRGDVVVGDAFEYMETATFATTGGVVWDAARRLIDYLEASAHDLGLDAPDVNILELGSGTGWMGMVVAQNVKRAGVVCLTEMEAGGALEWLSKNVARNEPAALWPPGRLVVEALDWTEFHVDDANVDASADGGGVRCSTSNGVVHALPWDVVVGSDLVYNEDGARMLPRVFRGLIDRARAVGKTAPLVLYAHTKYRYELLDILFFESLEQCGLTRVEVREPGVATPPASPEPLTELFPEKRIAVFRIELAAKHT